MNFLKIIGIFLFITTLCPWTFAKDLSVPKKMSLSSKEIKNGATLSNSQVFNGFGCTGSNISPDLKWSDAPTGTQAFAVTVYDPDAPTGSGWWHWVLFNLPKGTTHLPAGVGTEGHPPLPTGTIQSNTDYGKPGYGGPCPPVGTKAHRYIFKVYALKDKIPLKQEASAAMVGFYINQLKLAEGTLEATYGR